MKKNIKAYLHSDWAVLSPIVAIFLLLGVYNLGDKSLFIDEVENIFKSSSQFRDIFSFRFSKLFCLILHFWSKFFPLNEFSARLPPVIFGAASVVALFFLARRLFDRKTALLSAFFLAISPLFVLHSRMVLSNSLATFLSILQINFFLRILHGNKVASWIIYVLLSIACVFNHESIFLILLFELFYLIIFRRDLLGQWLIIFLGLALVIFVFSPGSSLRIMTVAHMAGASISGLVFGVKNTLYGFYLLSLGTNILPWKFFITAPAICLYAAIFISSIIKLKRSPVRLIFLLLYFLLPVFVLGFNKSIFLPRQIVFLVPAYCLIIAFGVVNIRGVVLKAAVVCLLVVFSFYGLGNYYLNRQFQWGSYVEPVREVAGYLAGGFNPRTDIIVLSDTPTGANALVLDYYMRLFNKGYSTKTNLYFLYNEAQLGVMKKSSLFQQYRQLNRGYRRVWYVIMNPPYLFPERDRGLALGAFGDWLATDCTFTQSRFFLPDIDAKEKRFYSGKASVPDYRAKVGLYYINSPAAF